MDNAAVARLLDEVADLLEILGENPFRVRAYRTAARTLETMPEAASSIVDRDAAELAELPGIARDLAGKIAEIVKTGGLALHRELVARVPAGLTMMMRVANIGPKRAKLFFDELGIRSLDELEAAAARGELHGIRGVGETLEKRILEGCSAEHARSGRFTIMAADAHAASLVAYLRSTPDVARVEVAGSLRRRRETIGDIDVLVATRAPNAVVERFLVYPEFSKILAHGKTKCTAMLRSGLQVDIRIVDPECWGAALHYFTGSKAHNIAIRTLGLKRKLKINEYGVFRGRRRISGASEAEVFEAVGLPWIPPELREDRGEVERASEGSLPNLLELADIHGDLHVHTASEGDSSLRTMVEACLQHGYEYVAITNRANGSAGTGAIDRVGLRRQRRAIDALRDRLPAITILHGAEVDILEDGGLDLDDDTLAELDVVVVAVQSKFDMPEPQMTARVLRAIAHPTATILAHPTGRLLGHRKPSALDMTKVVRAAKDRGVFLEIDARPDRLDLSDSLVKLARDEGARLVVGSDARRAGELDFMTYGVDQARRGWCTKHDVANTLSLAGLRRVLRGHAPARQRTVAGRGAHL